MPVFSERKTANELTEALMAEIRAFGRWPRRQNVDKKENSLAERLRHFTRKNKLTASQLAELDQLPGSDVSQAQAERTETVMQEIRALGYLPRQSGLEKSMRMKTSCINVCGTRSARVYSVSHSLLSWSRCSHWADRRRRNDAW